MSKFMQALDWLYRLLYLNALWVLFTIAGLLIFGLFPSTVSMFYIVKRWLNGDKDFAIFRAFFLKYKDEFIRSQIIGVILVVVSILLYFNIQFFFQKEGYGFYIFRYFMLTSGFVFVIMLPFLFPLLVQERIPLRELLKNVLFISITRIPHSVMMILGCMTIFYVFAKFAGLFIFFFGSTLAVWLTWNVKIAILKIHNKREVYNKKKNWKEVENV